MHVICPNCQFRGVIDVTLTPPETRLVCARCAMTLEAVSLNVEAQAAQSPDIWDSICGPIGVEQRDASPGRSAPDYLGVFEARSMSFSPGEDARPVSAVEDEKISPASSAELISPERTVTSQVGDLPAATAVSVRPQEHKTLPRPQSSRWSVGSLNPFRARPGHRPFPHRDKYFLLRISPVVVLSCVLLYLSLSSLSDLVAQPSETADRSSKARQTSSAAATQPSQPQPTPAATVQSSSEEPLLTAAEGIAPTGFAEPADAEPVDADEPDETNPEAPADHDDDGGAFGFTVQVGSYTDSEQANAQCAHLNSDGVESRMVKVELPGRGTWYRVQAGHFDSREEAARFGAQLQANRAVRNYIVTESELP